MSDLVEVVIYGAPDCGLCDDAKAILEPAAARLGFELRAVDITTDPELEARHRASIPVVEIDGAQAFVYHVLPSLLERRIKLAQAHRMEGSS